ncbi:MAG: NYN domain-containing protein [Cyanobacteria bacterium P01_D01_bin.73]
MASSPYATLLVDGYNAIGQWSQLKKLKYQAGLEAARDELVEQLTSYSAYRNYKTQVVFDAQFSKNFDRRRAHDKITDFLSVFYTDFGQTADTYIEKSCAAFRDDIANYGRRIIVATSDRAQQMTVTGYGAEWMSCQQLQHDLDASARELRQDKRRSPKARSSRFLGNRVNEKMRQKLMQMRLGLESGEA